VSCTTFWPLPWRSRSQHDFAAKSCPVHNFIIWSWILKLLHRNDHHIETMCHAQHLGRYLEGHSMTWQQNHVRPITLLLEVGYNNYFTAMITILNQRVTCNIWVLLWRSRSQHDLAAKLCLAHVFLLCYLKSNFTTISQKWSPYWDNVSCTTFLHFELCLWHNSDTTRDIPSCVQNLFGEHHLVQLALVSKGIIF
jgi:hypothetical protein